MTSILHVSDTHGVFQPIPATDVIIHTGDFFGNRTFGIENIERPYQQQWTKGNVHVLKRWIGGARFLFIPGNHDYWDPCAYLRDNGVDAWSLHVDGPTKVGDYGVFGFPYVPYFYGTWNHECDDVQMRERIQRLELALSKGEVDILACHAPIHGVLDMVSRSSTRAGSKIMREVLEACEHPPKYVLHGHMHDAVGLIHWKRGIMVSNAATTHRRIELP